MIEYQIVTMPLRSFSSRSQAPAWERNAIAAPAARVGTELELCDASSWERQEPRRQSVPRQSLGTSQVATDTRMSLGLFGTAGTLVKQFTVGFDLI